MVSCSRFICLFGSQIPVTTGGFELRISCAQSLYLTPSGLGNDFACKRFAVQTLLWSLGFVIQINLEHDTIAFTNISVVFITFYSVVDKINFKITIIKKHICLLSWWRWALSWVFAKYFPFLLFLV